MPSGHRLPRHRRGSSVRHALAQALALTLVLTIQALPVLGEDDIATASEASEKAPIAAENAPAGWRLAGEPLLFAGQNLYGHINGGAELFQEFGFVELLVRSYVRGEAAIDVEIYRMDSPEAALGIYLYQAGKGDSLAEIPTRNVGGAYQISLLRDSAFIQVNSFSGVDSLLPAMIDLAAACLDEIPAEEPEPILAILPETGRHAGTERLFRGPIALQPVFTFGPGDVFSQQGELFGALARYTNDAEGEHTLLRIRYGDELAAKTAYEHLLVNLDPYLTIRVALEELFVFEDYRQRYGYVKRLGAMLESRFDLDALPAAPPAAPKDPR